MFSLLREDACVVRRSDGAKRGKLRLTVPVALQQMAVCLGMPQQDPTLNGFLAFDCIIWHGNHEQYIYACFACNQPQS